MKPITKLNTIVLSITTAILFLGWIKLSELIIKKPELSVVLAGLMSIGIYRSVLKIFMLITRNSSWVKKQIFGPYYMDGTWVGYFIGNQNKVRFFIESFEQDFESIVIRGKSFKDDGGYHGSWIAEAVNINVKRAQITYHYNTDALGNTFINPGIAVFNFEREKTNKPPKKLIGFSSDLYSPYKLKALEEKISDELNYDTIQALEKAKDVYDKNKTFF